MSKTVELGWDRNAKAYVDHFRSTGYSSTITTTTSEELRGTTVRIKEPTWCVTDKDLTRVKKIIFNPPATIVIWEDGHKEIVKCNRYEEFQPEVGVSMCFMKRLFGSRHKFTKLVDEAWSESLEGYLKKVRRHEKRLKNPKAKVRIEKKYPEW